MPAKQWTGSYTPEQKTAIIARIKAVCVAKAELWDTLRDIECADGNEGLQIETDIYLIGELAGGCEFPPSLADLPDEEVWESFLAHTEAEVW